MLRLERLESDVGEIKGAIVNISAILLRHEERLDTMTQRMDTMCERMDTMCEQQTHVVERLDRLIEVTIKARTQDAERHSEVERRLTRLEELAGLPKL